MDTSKAGQLLAPSLPPFVPSDGTSADTGNRKSSGKKPKAERPRERREREGVECACDG